MERNRLKRNHIKRNRIKIRKDSGDCMKIWKKLPYKVLLIAAILFAVFPSKKIMAESAISQTISQNTGKNSTIKSQQEVGEDYQKISFLDLDEQEDFKISSDQITKQKNEKGKGLLISGKISEMKNTTFSIEKVFDFNEKPVGRLCVDGLASRGKTITLSFYLDNETTSFTKVTLRRQKQENKWTYEGDMSVDLTGRNLTGKHKLSFSVDQTSGKSVEFLLRSIEFAQSSVPTLYFNIDEASGTIDAMNNDDSHETECYGSVDISVPDDYKSEYSNASFSSKTYELDYVRGRGNSTWSADKKPYKVKLDKKADLFGMGASKHWVLLANRYDNSKLRNKATYWLGQQLGMEYTPQSIFVDVVMNGQYYGNYYLSEQIRVGDSRVEIDDLEADDDTKNSTDPSIISGGYLLSMMPYGTEDKLSFSTTRDNQYLIESPSFEEYKNETQFTYIKDYVQNVEDAIYGKDFKNKEGTPYEDLMDIDSAIDYYWIQEISKNGDAFGSTSTYLYKKRDGKLFWGPLWDFDYVAWGDLEYEDANVTDFSQNTATWFDRLFEDPVFGKKVAARWPKIKEKLLELTKDNGQLDQYAKELAVSEYYDYEKWGCYNESNDEEGNGTEDGSTEGVKNYTFDQEVSYLRSWITKRISWMDENVNSLIPKSCTVTFTNEGKVISSENGTVGKCLSAFPEDPKKQGYVFLGWVEEIEEDGESYETSFNQSSILAGDTIVYAKWIPESEVIYPEKLYFERQKVYLSSWSDGMYLPVTAIPFETTKLDIHYSSSDESIATVDENGYVSVQGPGTAVITADAGKGVKTSCMVYVVEDEKANYGLDGLVLAAGDITMNMGDYKKLDVQMIPEDTVDVQLSYGSSDSSVVSVSETGVLHAEGEGTATIIVYNSDILEMCTVTVTGENIMEESFIRKNIEYSINSQDQNTVTCVGTSNRKIKNLIIPNIVKNQGKTYMVAGIEKGAFKNCMKLESVKLGANIFTIGQNAFSGCKRLYNVSFNTTKIKKVADKAFRGIRKNAVFQCPSSKKMKYKKLLKKSTGFGKGMTLRDNKIQVGDQVNKNGIIYQVSKVNADGGTIYVKGTKKQKSETLTIPSYVTMKKEKFTVTAMGSACFKDYTKLKKLLIYSEHIGYVGDDALKHISKNATIIVPQRVKGRYKKLFTAYTGFQSSMKIQ